jgi:hypothetical protein
LLNFIANKSVTFVLSVTKHLDQSISQQISQSDIGPALKKSTNFALYMMFRFGLSAPIRTQFKAMQIFRLLSSNQIEFRKTKAE